MLDIISSIADLISSLVSFIVTSLQSLVYLITRIPSYISFLGSTLTVIPVVFAPFILASISIYVIYLILGRE